MAYSDEKREELKSYIDQVAATYGSDAPNAGIPASAVQEAQPLANAPEAAETREAQNSAQARQQQQLLNELLQQALHTASPEKVAALKGAFTRENGIQRVDSSVVKDAVNALISPLNDDKGLDQSFSALDAISIVSSSQTALDANIAAQTYQATLAGIREKYGANLSTPEAVKALDDAQQHAMAANIDANVITAIMNEHHTATGEMTASAAEQQPDQATVIAAVQRFAKEGRDGNQANDKEALGALRQALGIEEAAGYTNEGASTGADFVNNAQYDQAVQSFSNILAGGLSAGEMAQLKQTAQNIQLTRETAARDQQGGTLSAEQRQAAQTQLASYGNAGVTTAAAETTQPTAEEQAEQQRQNTTLLQGGGLADVMATAGINRGGVTGGETPAENDAPAALNNADGLRVSSNVTQR